MSREQWSAVSIWDWWVTNNPSVGSKDLRLRNSRSYENLRWSNWYYFRKRYVSIIYVHYTDSTSHVSYDRLILTGKGDFTRGPSVCFLTAESKWKSWLSSQRPNYNRSLLIATKRRLKIRWSHSSKIRK